MRKLKLQMQLSVDGYVCGPNGEMDWMTWNWDDEIKRYVTQITEPVDCILLGRKLAEGFIPHWAAAVKDPKTNDSFSRKMNDTPKVVFSNTLPSSVWENATLANGNIVDQVNGLKSQQGGDIIAYGGATLVSNLIGAGLIDDLYLFINPVAIGKGMAIFKDRTNMTLTETKQFPCGITVLHYQPIK